MRSFNEVQTLLKQLNVPYEIVEHPASHSTEESDSYIEGYEGCRSKSLVLANKKSTQFYMIIMDDAKQISFERLGELLNVKRLHLASENRLEELLGLYSGIVSFFGLVDTQYDNFHIYFDKDMIEQNPIMTFHPNDNTKTIFLPTKDCFKILNALGYSYEIVDFN